VVFDPGDTTAPADCALTVLPASDELRFPNVDRAALAMLASVSGGQLVELPDIGKITGQLKGERKLVPVRQEASLWDNWLMAVLLVVVYSVDVGLRRLRGLS